MEQLTNALCKQTVKLFDSISNIKYSWYPDAFSDCYDFKLVSNYCNVTSN